MSGNASRWGTDVKETSVAMHSVPDKGGEKG